MAYAETVSFEKRAKAQDAEELAFQRIRARARKLPQEKKSVTAIDSVPILISYQYRWLCQIRELCGACSGYIRFCLG
jgi:hypothetical protein